MTPLPARGVLDDDKAKRRFRSTACASTATRDDLERVATKTARRIWSSPYRRLLRRPCASCARQPSGSACTPSWSPLASLVNHNPTARDIRDIDLEGPPRTPPDPPGPGCHRVLAQSAHRCWSPAPEASIGSELCRQIARFSPARLILLDRDESALHSLQIDLDGNGLLSADNIALCDIRDLDGLRRVFREHQPSIVFHAAALKHLPCSSASRTRPGRNNVLGTLNVLRVSAENDVKTFVNISTDKAADPTCVLGYSKRLAERMTAHFARAQHGRYMSVRFGNVLGSRGSVIPAFTAQIQRGGPITVTHPEVKRYFMLIPRPASWSCRRP